MFGNYLNIWKLIFIWINLDLKLVLKKTNLKLVLFRPNFFTFYFISSHYYFSYFILINSFSIDLDNHPPPSSTTIRRRHTLSFIADYRRRPSAATDCHRRPALTTTDGHTVPHCLSLFATATRPVLHRLLSLVTIVFHCLHCLSTTATTARCR